MDLANTSPISYLSIFGVVILFVCVTLILTQRAITPLRTPEKIKAFGVELEISVLTLLVLVGFLLSISSIYLHVNGYQKQVIEFQKNLLERDAQMAEQRKQLEASKKIDMAIYVRLLVNSGSDNQPKLSDLTANYYLRDQSEPIEVDIGRGVDGNTYKVLFKNITSATYVESLELRDAITGHVWVKQNFFPLNPTYDLKKEGQP